MILFDAFQQTRLYRDLVTKYGDMEPRERLAELADLLDDYEELPAAKETKFIWNYSIAISARECGTPGCALGLAVVNGMIPDFKHSQWGPHVQPAVLDTFAISNREADELFGGGITRMMLSYGVDKASEVTPQMVAAKIRDFLGIEKTATQPKPWDVVK